MATNATTATHSYHGYRHHHRRHHSFDEEDKDTHLMTTNTTKGDRKRHSSLNKKRLYTANSTPRLDIINKPLHSNDGETYYNMSTISVDTDVTMATSKESLEALPNNDEYETLISPHATPTHHKGPKRAPPPVPPNRPKRRSNNNNNNNK